MKLKFVLSSLALIAASTLALSACGGAEPAPQSTGSPAARGGTLTLGALGEPKSFDPSQAHVAHSLPWYQTVYDTLILREPDGTLSPMLATAWTYNEDNTVLTIDLRTDVTFSDGEAFDAEAAVANIENFQAGNGPQAGQLAAVSSVSATDEDTIELTLTAPDPALEYYLSQAAGLMGSPAAIGTEAIAREPVGSGPYVISASETVAGSQYVFTAREDYWNPDLQKFDKIVLRPMTDVTARVNGLVSGQLDGALLDPLTSPQAEQAGLTKTSNEVNWEGLLLMDRDGAINPALADVRVRQAFNYAIDKATILEQLNGDEGTVTSQVFGKESGAWVEDLEDAYDYDPDKARDLLADAGYEDGFTVQIPTTTGFESMMAVLSQQLGEVGITLEQVSVPFANFQTDLGAGKFPIAYFRLFQGEPWVAINQMISTEALYNPFDSSTPELDEMIAAVQNGGEESATLAQDVNQYVTEEAWFAPFFRADTQYFTSKRVTVEPQIQQVVPSIYNYSAIG